MAEEDVLRWLRDEHDGIHELADRLRERIARPPRGSRENWIRELRERFDSFASCLRERMARQEAGGYLRPVCEARPSLVGQVEMLKHEQDELKRLVDDVQHAVHKLSPRDMLLLRDCCKRIESLLSWFERHEEHENHIVLYVFSTPNQGAPGAAPPA